MTLTVRSQELDQGRPTPSASSSPDSSGSESGRIEFLVHRDGHAAARAWIERTAGLYRDALLQRGSHAMDPVYRPRFERAVREFEDWLRRSLA